jgi:hypothetical protein
MSPKNTDLDFQEAGQGAGGLVIGGMNRYFYSLDSFRVFPPSATEEPPLELAPAAISVFVQADYDTDAIHPVVGISLMCTHKELEYLQRNADRGRAVMNVSKFSTSLQANADMKPETLPLPEPMWESLEFDILDAPDPTPPSRNTDAARKPDSDSQRIHRVDLGMLLVEHLNIAKRQFSEILSDCTPSAAMTFVMQSNYTGRAKFFVSKADNDAVEEQIHLGTGNLIEVLMHLQRKYQIYTMGMRVFLDLDRYYIMSSDPSKSPFAPDEYKAIHFRVVDQHDTAVDSGGGMSSDEENKLFQIRIPSSVVTVNRAGKGGAERMETNAVVSIQSRTGGMRHYYYSVGKNFTVQKEEITHNRVAELLADPKLKVRHIEGEFDTPDIGAEYIWGILLKDTTIEVDLQAIDFDQLSYNKRYFFRFTNPSLSDQYDGEYMIMGLRWMMGPSGDGQSPNWVGKGRARFARVPGVGGSSFTSPFDIAILGNNAGG